MLYQQKKSAVEIAGIIGVGRATVYRYLEEMGQERNLQNADNQQIMSLILFLAQMVISARFYQVKIMLSAMIILV